MRNLFLALGGLVAAATAGPAWAGESLRHDITVDARGPLALIEITRALPAPDKPGAAETLLDVALPEHSVLVAVSPNQRVLEIVTGSVASTRILDRDCKLAALSMSAAFAGGDLGGGLVAGLAQLAEHAGRS